MASRPGASLVVGRRGYHRNPALLKDEAPTQKDGLPRLLVQRLWGGRLEGWWRGGMPRARHTNLCTGKTQNSRNNLQCKM